MELLDRNSNQNIVTQLRQILAGQGRDRLPDRTTRSPRQKHKRLKPNEVFDLVHAYRDGAQINILAKRFGINRTTVLATLRREGEQPRRGLMEERMGEAMKLRELGWSYAKIARHFGVQPNTVWYAFNRAETKKRTDTS